MRDATMRPAIRIAHAVRCSHRLPRVALACSALCTPERHVLRSALPAPKRHALAKRSARWRRLCECAVRVPVCARGVRVRALVEAWGAPRVAELDSARKPRHLIYAHRHTRALTEMRHSPVHAPPLS